MCSTLNRQSLVSSVLARKLVLLGCATVGGIAGCQRIVPPTATQLNNSPLIVDQAMQKREWDRSLAVYGNGDTVAGGTGYLWQTHETIPDGWRRLTDVPVAASNIVCEPIGFFTSNTPFKPQVYQGDMIPPTYTAQPPLTP